MFTSKRAKIEKKIEALHDDFMEKINTIAQEYFTEIIKPYLDKNKMGFKPGMGTWCWVKNGEIYDIYDHPRNKTIPHFDAILSETISGTNQCLGYFLNDYNI